MRALCHSRVQSTTTTTTTITSRPTLSFRLPSRTRTGRAFLPRTLSSRPPALCGPRCTCETPGLRLGIYTTITTTKSYIMDRSSTRTGWTLSRRRTATLHCGLGKNALSAYSASGSHKQNTFTTNTPDQSFFIFIIKQQQQYFL